MQAGAHRYVAGQTLRQSVMYGHNVKRLAELIRSKTIDTVGAARDWLRHAAIEAPR